MASPKYEMIFLYDSSTGLPKAGATPTFESYRDTAGTAIVPQPTIVELPGGTGAYGFIPTFPDATKGIWYIVDTGTDAVMPRRSSRYMRPEDWNGDNITPGGGGGCTVQFYSNGDTVKPIIIQVSAPRYTQVIVTFSEPVTMTTGPDGALNVSNYTIPGLTVLDAVQVSPTQVSLTTTAQTPDFLYTITVQHVTDIHGNVIVT